MAVEVGLGVFSGEWHPGTRMDHTQTLAESIDQHIGSHTESAENSRKRRSQSVQLTVTTD